MHKPLPSVGYVIVLNVKTIFSAWLRINKKATAEYMQTKLWCGDNDSPTTYIIVAVRPENFHGFKTRQGVPPAEALRSRG
jgi:hypothetical protein